MTETVLLDQDAMFFARHQDRQTHIREPWTGEKEGDFCRLGLHLTNRRRILVWKVPKGTRIGAGEILRIPFLKFSDETIQDTDQALLPILNELMQDAAKEHGIQPPRMK